MTEDDLEGGTTDPFLRRKENFKMWPHTIRYLFLLLVLAFGFAAPTFHLWSPWRWRWLLVGVIWALGSLYLLTSWLNRAVAMIADEGHQKGWRKAIKALLSFIGIDLFWPLLVVLSIFD